MIIVKKVSANVNFDTSLGFFDNHEVLTEQSFSSKVAKRDRTRKGL